jgi:hypothetical protein|tara:strand:+ start:629 stop:751 length:123 start_codon:yes stop_codon:yes gene_type:complete
MNDTELTRKIIDMVKEELGNQIRIEEVLDPDIEELIIGEG